MKQYAILLYLLLTLGAGSLTTTKAQVDVNDSLALVDLYNSTNGPGWINHNNWLTTNPVSTWYGIDVKGTRVTSILLGYDQLSGHIPSSIGNLTNLSSIVLASNQLSGSIPSSIGNLVYLDFLDLSNNQLSGAIPATIGNLRKLRSLYLNLNQLSGSIPATINNLANLETLDLKNNQLSGTISPSIGKLRKLTFLGLTDNQLSGNIPVTIGNLSKLYYLELAFNQLSGSIPPIIGNLVNLTALTLNNNQLSGEVPHSFKRLRIIYNIDFSYNQLVQNSNIEDLYGEPEEDISGPINNNLFTFNGLEFVAKKFPGIVYTPQAHIPIHQYGNTLAVYAGGTLSNNTYNWFKTGETDSTIITGDSTFTPTQDGKYYVKVTNAIATQLTLYSDTIDYAVSSLTVNNRLSADINRSKLKQGLQVSPNPATSIVNVRVNGNANIILTNSSGKVMLTKAINNTGALNVSALANGVYYIQNKATGEVQKVVVSH